MGVGGLQTDGSTYLAVNSGNVGIGTTNPGSYKLNIQGGDVKVGSAVTIKGDGTVSTGLNAEKVGGYTAAELMTANVILGSTGGTHSGAACVALGGTVVFDGVGYYMCKFNGASCPSGWTQYSTWRTTAPNTCTGGCYYTGVCAGGCSFTSCTTGSHAFSNVAVETCSYTTTVDGWGSCGSWTCTATITQVGCY